MKTQLITRAIGAPLNRVDGVQKVTGTAKYAYEYSVEGVTHVFPVQSTIAKGRVVSIDAHAAQALPGVIAVLSHENAPRLAPVDDAELAVFQSDAIAYHGQFVAAVVAETSEIARQAASLVVVRYEEQPHDVELRADRGDLSTPERLINGDESDTESGDVEAALTPAAVSLDHTYTTPAEHKAHTRGGRPQRPPQDEREEARRAARDDLEVRRAGGPPDGGDVRGAEPPHHAPAGAARHARADDHACPWRVPRHVRAGVS